MINTYRDSYTPKKLFIHFNVLGFKFRVKTYIREHLKKYNMYTDRQGLGLNFSKLHFKIYQNKKRSV